MKSYGWIRWYLQDWEHAEGILRPFSFCCGNLLGRCIFNAQFLLAADSLVVMKLLFGLESLCFTLTICACADVGSREYPERRVRRLGVYK